MNRGLHGSMACMLLPLLLLVAGLIVTALNKSDFGK